MINTNQLTNQSLAFWPSNILRSDDNLHSDFVAKLLVYLQINRSRLPAIEIEELTNACKWLIEGLYQSHFSIPKAPLLLPLSKEAFGNRSIYRIPFSYRVVKRVFEAVKELNFVEVVMGTYIVDKKGTLTRLRPTGRLLKHFEELGLRWRYVAPSDGSTGIFINPGKGSAQRRLANRKDSQNISLMQDRLFKINEFIGEQCISIDLSNAALKANLDSKRNVDYTINLLSSSSAFHRTYKSAMGMQNVFLHRVFVHGSMTKGGRFYGAWWQQIRSKLRRRILINENKTVECDFSGLACSMLYAKEGLLPPTDSYDIGLNYSQDDPRRDMVKKYMNAMLNDSSKRYRLAPAKLAVVGLTHSELHERLCNLHAPIEKYFNSGIGVDLQYDDSEIAQEVMLRLMDSGEVCLPIHDSFIVRIQAVELLWKTMNDVFQERFSQSPGIKPEMGYRGLSMGKPRKTILSTKQLSIAEQFSAHISEYSVIKEFNLSWEHANFTEEELEVRYHLMNDEHRHHKDLGLPAFHLHKFYGLPMLMRAGL